MRRYLATIHQKLPAHKKRFAFAVSGAVTLLIFGIWSLATFGPTDSIVAEGEQEFSPISSLVASIGSAFKILRTNVGDLEKGLETVNTYDR